MQPFPTVKQVQQALPFNLDIEYTTSGGEAYSLPSVMGGALAPVQQTLTLCGRNMCYYVCAVVKEHSWEPKYNTAGCKDWFIAGWNVTLARHSSKLGQQLLEFEFGQNVSLFGLDMLVVNVGGGPVPNCASFTELACLIGYQLFKQHLEPRKHRLKHDLYSIEKFTDLKIYRKVLDREIKIQQDFEGIYLSSLHSLKDVVNLDQRLSLATEGEMASLQSFRNEAIRLENEAKELAKFPSKSHLDAYRKRKRQEQEKIQQVQEDNEHREQARLQAEQEKDTQRKEQLERCRIEHLHQAQVQEERRLKLQHQQRRNHQQELLQAQYAILPTSEELKRRLRGLATFYPPSRDNYDAYVQQLKLLSIACKRCLSSISKQNDTEKWRNALIEIKRLKTQCLKLAESQNWLRPEEDEAWKDL